MRRMQNKITGLFSGKIVSSSLSEVVIYIIIWLLILAEQIYEATNFPGTYQEHIIRTCLRDIPIIVLFFINTFWLVPQFLFNKKTLLYVLLVLFFSLLLAFIGDLNHIFQQAGIGGPGFMPHEPPVPMDDFGPENFPPERLFGFGFLNKMILAWLVVSLNTAIKVTIKWYKDEQSKREMEKEYLKSELSFLQNQVSPHFFMNTLNNIHALIDINGKNAQLAIVKLSRMMRYLLYESDQGNTVLKKEIEFLESYVALMRLRIDETVRVNLSINVKDDNVKLPPLLLIPFIENAFKHGISYREKSYINISVDQEGRSLIFTCTNSKVAKNKPAPESGIGLKNVQKRLDLIYGNAYDLVIDDTDTEFNVKLILFVYEY
jgi:two-component system, LytTR family, sensor kinase